MATAFASSSSPQIATFLSSSLHSKPHSYLPLPPSLRTTSPITTPSNNFILFHNPIKKNNSFRPIFPLPPPAAAGAEDAITSSSAVDAAEQLYKSTDQGVATVVSALFFIAFVGLSAITIGVVYLVVTDFLQKREKDKFEKEEAAKAKNRKKNKKVGRARAGPRGFGQKLVQDQDED